MVTVAKKKDIDPAFGRRLRAIRESASLTQADLGRKAGMLPHVVARLELGQREPGWQTVLKLAAALGVGPEAFVEPPDGA
jgi:transcriptional regulator with XRE-family HTH domain